MNDVTFNIDQIRRAAVELISDRCWRLDEKFAAYAKGVADLCRALVEIAGEEDEP